ncbi:unnamed protein product [Pleuronectes platessa]|uniref:Uncharacterized protein n=1 Tax=Pleuronectes platessa TaxID=8262 RepID=A0A9N7Y733_PLEPL|nr:unnamed protein product [Pleuronectes platessa]
MMTPFMRQMHPLHPSWTNKAGPGCIVGDGSSQPVKEKSRPADTGLGRCGPVPGAKKHIPARQTGHIWGASDGGPSPFRLLSLLRASVIPPREGKWAVIYELIWVCLPRFQVSVSLGGC